MSFFLLNRTCKVCGNSYAYSITNDFMTYWYCSKRCILAVEKVNNEKEANNIATIAAKGSLISRLFGKDNNIDTSNPNKLKSTKVHDEEINKFKELLDAGAISQKDLKMIGIKIIEKPGSRQ